MAWVTPVSVSAGDAILASKWNQDVVLNAAELAPLFSAWTSYTPQIDQGATTNVTKTVTYARYLKVGRLAIVQFRLDITGTGTASAAITVTLPSAIVPVSTGTSGGTFGFGDIYDATGSTNYNVNIRATSTTQLSFQSDATATNYFGAVPNVQLKTNCYISGTFICETTS